MMGVFKYTIPWREGHRERVLDGIPNTADPTGLFQAAFTAACFMYK